MEHSNTKSTDWRELCEELVQLDTEQPSEYADWKQRWNAAINRARAALTQPEPEVVGPTDEELDRLEHPHWEETGVEEWGRREAIFNHRSYARAVLARWGNQPAPTAEGEVAELVAWLRMQGLAQKPGPNSLLSNQTKKELHAVGVKLTRAADLLERQVITEDSSATASAPAEGEVADETRYLVKELRDQADDLSPSLELFGLIHRAANLLAQRHPAPAPVPVSERLPGPEDCDVDGRCWWFDINSQWYFRSQQEINIAGLRQPTHWLPAHALPLPQGGEVE